MRVALAGCTTVADPDEPALVEALARRGVAAEGRPWDSGADWSAYDLVVVRSTWDYTSRREEFLRWARRVPRLANPAGLLAWNSDKTYLGELAAAGLPVIPTAYLEPGAAEDGQLRSALGEGDIVVKPTVSAGGRDTARYGRREQAAAAAHVRALHAAGRAVMLQPYLASIEVQEETSVLFLAGVFSHGARKGPVLSGRADVGPRVPSAQERALAERVLAVLDRPPLYARVDLLAGPDGPLLLELEVTEPCLFLSTSEGAADRFAAAICRVASDPAGIS